MKISLNGINSYQASREIEKASVAASKPQSTRNFDGITIRAKTMASPEQVFEDHLSRKISMEVRRPASGQLLEDLKNQIQSGTYEVDANAIADKILLIG